MALLKYLSALISPLFLAGAELQAWVSVKVGAALRGLNDGKAVFSGEWDAATYSLFILGYTLAADFSIYIVHRVHHISRVLCLCIHCITLRVCSRR